MLRNKSALESKRWHSWSPLKHNIAPQKPSPANTKIMSTRHVSYVRCRQARSQKLLHSAAYGERGSNCSLSHRQSYGNGGMEKHIQPLINFKEQIGQENGAKGGTKRGGQPQKLRLWGFSYLASSFRYIRTKVKTFYNGIFGDVGNDFSIGNEAPMVEPYFSMPVLPNAAPPIF